jgi:hypothetical protein
MRGPVVFKSSSPQPTGGENRNQWRCQEQFATEDQFDFTYYHTQEANSLAVADSFNFERPTQ